jgi:hypothetical protein
MVFESVTLGKVRRGSVNNRLLLGTAITLVVIVGGWMIVYVPQVSPIASDASTVSAATITYTDKGFSPSTLDIKTGGIVHVQNHSKITLEFASGSHPDHSQDPELNMAPIEPGDEGVLKVTRSGSWMFHNHLRDEDTGMLTVRK